MTQEHRRDKRLLHDKRVLLQFTERLGVVGTTKDISSGGAFVLFPFIPKELSKGMTGTFRLISNPTRYQYTFELVRLESEGAGIRFIDPPDDFVVNMMREL